MQLEKGEEVRRKIDDVVKSTQKVVTMQERLNRAVTAGDRKMSEFWRKTITATKSATREVEAFNRSVQKMTRNERDMAFSEQFGRGRAGKLGNPFTGQGMGTGSPAEQVGGKVGKTINTLDKIGNAAAVLSLFDTFTSKISETANSLKKWDGSLISSTKLLGDFGGIIFSGIGLVTQLMEAFVLLRLASVATAAKMATGGAAGAAGSAVGGAAGGAAAGAGVGAGAAAIGGTLLAAVLAAAGIAYGIKEFIDARDAAEQNAASRSKDATGKGKAMTEQRKQWQAVAKQQEKMAAAQEKLRLKTEKDRVKEQARLEKLANQAVAKKLKEEERIAKAAERAAKAMEKAAETVFSKSEEFIRALLPNTFAQPAQPVNQGRDLGLGGYVQNKFRATNYEAQRLLDSALGYGH